MSNLRYLIGLGTTAFPDNGLPARLSVVYLPKPSWVKPTEPEDPHILVEIWQDGNSDGATRPPKEMLAYRPYAKQLPTSDSTDTRVKYIEEPPGWFARRCRDANCSWFIPLVERMAAGESITVASIRSAYSAHNAGKELPSGSLGAAFL